MMQEQIRVKLPGGERRSLQLTSHYDAGTENSKIGIWKTTTYNYLQKNGRI
jgi:hypothetical protein